ncbi:MAG: hypothetical protein V7K68_24595 [Nostoc sp.]|uniref:hypothetical protein n=1 Tax=Nostoc sp. TaxID=1180 RepID=UPI002FFCE750
MERNSIRHLNLVTFRASDRSSFKSSASNKHTTQAIAAVQPDLIIQNAVNPSSRSV